jgi:hypothetical protein
MRGLGQTRTRMPNRSQLLTVVLACGVADAVLLAVLIFFAFIDRERTVVAVVGTTHGLNFLALLALTAWGACQRLRSWSFPIAVALTLGPPGSILGEIRLRRRVANKPALARRETLELDR